MITLVTTWPTGQDLRAWLGGSDVLTNEALVATDDIVLDATAVILERVDETKLPVDPAQCPRSLARAIILEAARLLSRKDSTNGVVSFGEFAARLANVDVDIEACLRAWGTDPEP